MVCVILCHAIHLPSLTFFCFTIHFYNYSSKCCTLFIFKMVIYYSINNTDLYNEVFQFDIFFLNSLLNLSNFLLIIRQKHIKIKMKGMLAHYKLLWWLIESVVTRPLHKQCSVVLGILNKSSDIKYGHFLS